MAKDKVTMPSSQGGLVRYLEDYKSKIVLKPEHVLLIIVMVILIEIILHSYGTSFLGLK